MNIKIGIIGSGSWASALAIALSQVASIRIICRNQAKADSINVTKQTCLPIKFGDNVEAYSNISDLCGVNLIIIATPVSSLSDIVTKLAQYYRLQDFPDLIWACKGFDADTYVLPHQIIEDGLLKYSINTKRVGALLGPSFALEVAKSLPTALSLVSHDVDFLNTWSWVLQKIKNIRIYKHNDVIGSEVASGTKNIIAIACGIIDGLGLGDNAKSALITRSLNEISLLIDKLGGNPKTVYGLTGIGDLVLTCNGNLSRNRQVGLGLASGKLLPEILENLGHVAEGVYATTAVFKLAQKLNLDMPIINTIYQVLHQGYNIHLAISDLLNRTVKSEL